MFDWLGKKIGFTISALSEGIVHCFQIFFFFPFFLQLHKLQSSLNILIIFVYAELRGVKCVNFHWSPPHPHHHHSASPPCGLQQVYVHLIYGPEGN